MVNFTNPGRSLLIEIALVGASVMARVVAWVVWACVHSHPLLYVALENSLRPKMCYRLTPQGGVPASGNIAQHVHQVLVYSVAHYFLCRVSIAAKWPINCRVLTLRKPEFLSKPENSRNASKETNWPIKLLEMLPFAIFVPLRCNEPTALGKGNDCYVG